MDFEPVGAAPVRSFTLATAELGNAHHAALCRLNQAKCAAHIRVCDIARKSRILASELRQRAGPH